MSDRLRRILGGAVTLALLGVVAFGVMSDARTDQERLADLGDRIKCPVCSGNSIIDSPHPYAADMVALVEQQIAEGRTDDEILEFFEARYSDTIRLDAGAGSGMALWVLPIVALAAGSWLVLGRRRKEQL